MNKTSYSSLFFIILFFSFSLQAMEITEEEVVEILEKSTESLDPIDQGREEDSFSSSEEMEETSKPEGKPEGKPEEKTQNFCDVAIQTKDLGTKVQKKVSLSRSGFFIGTILSLFGVGAKACSKKWRLGERFDRASNFFIFSGPVVWGSAHGTERLLDKLFAMFNGWINNVSNKFDQAKKGVKEDIADFANLLVDKVCERGEEFIKNSEIKDATKDFRLTVEGLTTAASALGSGCEAIAGLTLFGDGIEKNPKALEKFGNEYWEREARFTNLPSCEMLEVDKNDSSGKRKWKEAYKAKLVATKREMDPNEQTFIDQYAGRSVIGSMGGACASFAGRMCDKLEETFPRLRGTPKKADKFKIHFQ